MAQSSALDTVIRRVFEQPKDHQLAPDQKLVCIDPKTKEIIQKRFGFLLRKPLFYIVTHATRPENVVESTTPVIPIKVDQGITIPVEVQYQVKCPKGNEEQVAKALSNYDTPQESLHKCVEEIIYEYFMIGKDNNYDNSSKDIEHILSKVAKGINQEVYNRIGLDFSAKVQLHHYEQVAPYVIHDLAIAVRTMDSDQEFTLRLSIDLNISDRYIAALKYPKLYTIKDLIIEIVQEYCRNKLTTQSLFVDTNVNEKVLKELENIINQLMINHGRFITWLQIKIDKDSFGIEPFLTLKLDIPRTPHLSTENIVIHNDLQLEVKDAGKYINIGKPKLKAWAQKTLEDLFERELFEWTYLKFLLEFPQLKSKIEKEMQNAANNIGYKVRYIITEPNLKENRLLRADTYIWKYEDLPTAVPDVSVNLQVSTVFYIKDFNAIKNLLNRNMDVEAAIRDFIGKLLVERLHRTDPETVYMRFNIADVENRRSLQEDLQYDIAQRLKEEYSADIESVKIVPLDTKIITFFGKMQYKLTPFEIQIIPKNQNDRPVNLKGTVSVVNPHPNGWLRLHRCDFELEDIVNFVKETLHTELLTYSSDALISLTPEHRKELEYVASV